MCGPCDRNSAAFLEGSHSSPSRPSYDKMTTQIRVWDIDGTILMGDKRSTRNKTSPSVTLSTTNPMRTGLGSNACLCGERPATNCLSHSTDRTQNIQMCYRI